MPPYITEAWDRFARACTEVIRAALRGGTRPVVREAGAVLIADAIVALVLVLDLGGRGAGVDSCRAWRSTSRKLGAGLHAHALVLATCDAARIAAAVLMGDALVAIFFAVAAANRFAILRAHFGSLRANAGLRGARTASVGFAFSLAILIFAASLHAAGAGLCFASARAATAATASYASAIECFIDRGAANGPARHRRRI
jgi:hypothetical protein